MTTVVDRLAAGTAFVDVSAMRAIGVSGTDARTWLNDLVSADLADLEAGGARPSLLLAPTGGIRASFTVIVRPDGLLLVQDRSQERSVLDLLAPYVLSSDVTLTDRAGELAAFAFPGLASPPSVAGAWSSAPSVLGRGSDLFAPIAEHARVMADLERDLVRASADEAEAWRIGAGIPRVGIDTAEGDLPQEAALERAVSFDKGCFVGQEAVAKTRNLGHPRRVLVALSTDDEVATGDPVVTDEGDAGSITSAARIGERTFALARVRWSDRDRAFRTRAGVPLELAG
ncbi:MAG TPA: hypothetical protein VIE12_06615 [Actinomycetota bacterium]|jgi:folate-binding protein YgfZ